MSNSEQDREERAKKLRPKVAEKVKKARSRRQAATAIGVSDTTLGRFLDGETPFAPTLDLYEAWVAGRARGEDAASGNNGNDHLARQIDEVIAMPGEWNEKSLFMAEVAATYRARAIDRAEERALLREKREERRLILPEGPLPRPPEKDEEEAAA